VGLTKRLSTRKVKEDHIFTPAMERADQQTMTIITFQKGKNKQWKVSPYQTFVPDRDIRHEKD